MAHPLDAVEIFGEYVIGTISIILKERL